MKEKLAGIWETIKTFWQSASKKVKAGILAAIGGIVVLCVVLVVMVNQEDYALLYNDLSSTESAKVLSIINEMGVEPDVKLTGEIYVPAKDLNRVRMQLATQGYAGTSFSYDTYNDGVGLTSTQTDKNTQYVFQLQDRLQATIETLDEVTQAVVTISLPEKNTFALQSDVVEPSASVTIIRRPGRQLSNEQIQGILNIVRTGVPGISEENISIVDSEMGDLKLALSIGGDSDTTKLNLTEQVNASIRSRVLSVVQPLYGAGHVEVAVNATLDTNTRVTETTRYNPLDEENPTVNPFDSTEHERAKTGDAGGVAEGVPGAEDNVGTPQYGENMDDLANAAAYSSYDYYDYLVGSTKEQIVKEGLEITGVSVAVVIDSGGNLTERDAIEALVANASGAPIDNITVRNFEFAKDAGTPADTITQIIDNNFSRVLLFLGLGLLALIVIAVAVVLLLRKRKKAKEEELAQEQEELLYDEQGQPLVDLLGAGEEFEPIPIMETHEQKLKAQIKDLAESDPEIVAQLIKTWLLTSS